MLIYFKLILNSLWFWVRTICIWPSYFIHLKDCIQPNSSSKYLRNTGKYCTSKATAHWTRFNTGVSNSRPGGQLRPAEWYFVAPYLTSKFSVRAARTLFSNTHFCWVLPHLYLFFYHLWATIESLVTASGGVQRNCSCSEETFMLKNC